MAPNLAKAASPETEPLEREFCVGPHFANNFHAFPVLSWALWAQPRTWLIAALLAVDSDPPKLTLN